MAKRIIITGGCGFIGSYVVEQFFKSNFEVLIIDLLDYAASPLHLAERLGRQATVFTEDPTGAGIRRFASAGYNICRGRNTDKITSLLKKEKLLIVHGSIGENYLIRELLQNLKPIGIVNLAALTHVDTSIEKPEVFLETNTRETFDFFIEVMKYSFHMKNLNFIHVSTDEVYGTSKGKLFKEDSPLLPRNPYSASKASAEMFLMSLANTYRFKARVVRPCNALGPGQNPEKFIPKVITNALKRKKIPLYGDGKHRREWLYAGDTASAIYHVFQIEEHRLPRIENYPRHYHVFNIGSGEYIENIELARRILKIIGAKEELIEFVEDRPGHDRFYGVDFSLLKEITGWSPSSNLDSSLKKTIDWYRKHLNREI